MPLARLNPSKQFGRVRGAGSLDCGLINLGDVERAAVALATQRGEVRRQPFEDRAGGAGGGRVGLHPTARLGKRGASQE